MKIYLDTGNIDEIRAAVDIGIIDGATTNPSLIAKENVPFEETVRGISSLIGSVTQDFTVSAEVTETDAEKMIEQGRRLARIDPHVLVKIPMTPDGIKAVRALAKQGIRVNVTLCFSANQALLAAKAGAWCISPFLGRLDDAGQDGMVLVEQIRRIYDTYGFDTRILAASIRHPDHVKQVALAGADIATMPYKVYTKLFMHPLTDSGLKAFMDDWEEYEGRR